MNGRNLFTLAESLQALPESGSLSGMRKTSSRDIDDFDTERATAACRYRTRHAGLLLVLLLISIGALADYKGDVGYTALQAEIGAGLPDGTGVQVSQVEAAVTVNGSQAWLPDPTVGELAGKTFTDVSGATPGVYSGHATSVAQKFYGNTGSTSGGVTDILAYLADLWVGDNFLRTNTGGGPRFQPR
ncbi:MAG TPA: hypothetical protein ENK16_01405, partial [Chromatiales bacterium]|nr:hypothetical protein [Chromatiales bacterium]